MVGFHNWMTYRCDPFEKVLSTLLAWAWKRLDEDHLRGRLRTWRVQPCDAYWHLRYVFGTKTGALLRSVIWSKIVAIEGTILCGGKR